MANVFVSYSRKDIEFAKRLTADLQKSGLNFWFDWESMPPTVDRWKEVEKSIEEAEVCLFLISPDFAKSKVCGWEIDCAVKNGKRLIPLVVRDIKEDERPYQLRHLNWIFLRERDDFDIAIKKLLVIILTDHEWAATHRSLQVQALKWERNHKAKSFLLRGKDLQDAELQLAANSSKEPYPTDLQREYVSKSREAAEGQRRMVIDVSIVGMIALAALAGFGLIQAGRTTSQANIAQTERANAEANLVAANTAQANAESDQATAFVNEQEAKKQAAISRSQVLAVNSQLYKNEDGLGLLFSIESFNLVNDFPHPDRKLAEKALLHSLDQVRGIQLSGHEDFIYTLAFSPDSRWLATGSYDNTTHLWDMKNPAAEPIVLHSHNGVTSTLAFSSDSQWLATGSYDNTAHLWDMKNPAAGPIVLSGHDGLISTLAFSPTSQWLATGSYDNTVRLWDMKNLTTESIVLRGHGGIISILTFSSDSQWLVTGSYDNTVRLWDMKNLIAEPIVLRGHGNRISALAFSPDGEWLATGSYDNTVHLWDMKDHTAEPIILHGHDGAISILAFSPDGQRLATGSYDNTARLWDMKSLTAEPIVLHGHGSLISTLAFSPDGQWLATGSYDNTVRLWDMTTPTAEPIVLHGHSSLISTLAFSQDDQWLATGSYDSTVRLWDLNYDHILKTACQVVGRNFTQAEWTKYFPNEKYRKTCEEWPLEAEAVVTQKSTP